MDNKTALVQYTPEELGELLEKACDANDGDAVRALSDLLSLRKTVLVPFETAQAFQALE